MSWALPTVVNGLYVGAGIVDGHIDRQVSQIGAGVALDGMQLFRVRMAQIIEPEFVVVSDRIDHQRVSFPMADGMAVPGGIGIVGMLRRS